MSGREEVIAADAYAGDTTHDGITTRAVHHLYAQMAKRADAKYQLSASHLEVGAAGCQPVAALTCHLLQKWHLPIHVP